MNAISFPPLKKIVTEFLGKIEKQKTGELIDSMGCANRSILIIT